MLFGTWQRAGNSSLARARGAGYRSPNNACWLFGSAWWFHLCTLVVGCVCQRVVVIDVQSSLTRRLYSLILRVFIAASGAERLVIGAAFKVYGVQELTVTV